MALKYREEQRQVQLYDYLVYICGVEVSSFTRSIEVVKTTRSGPGSATIVFANPFDQWVMTRSNFEGTFRRTSDRYSEIPKLRIYEKKKKISLTFKTKAQVDPTIFGSLDEADEFENKLGTEAFQQRYAFGPGSCIFSKMDTVRIFIKNPYTDSNDEWIPFFTGTIDTKPLVTNFITGESSVTVNCFDIRSAMQGMRISVNPFKNDVLAGKASVGASGTSSTDTTTGTTTSSENIASFSSEDAGYFKDFYPTIGNGTDPKYTNVFAGKSFVDAISMLVTGKTGWVNGPQAVPEGSGVGEFTPGKVFRYTNAQAVQSLKATKNTPIEQLVEWDLLCLFGESRDFWTFQQCKTVGEGSFYDGKYHPFTGKLHWLLPSDKLPISSMFEETLNGINDIMGSPDWTDRFSLLCQMCNQVDYEFTVSGNGDLMMEFPMYDISPDNFGGTSAGSKAHGNIYVTEQHVVSENISDEAGEVLSGLEAVSISSRLGDRQATENVNQTAAQLNVPDMRVIVFNNTLASKYGARVQNVSFTGVQTEEALKRLALIEFQKRLAEANKLSLEMVFRPFLQPNRPFLYSERNRTRMGKITTVTYVMPALQEPTMSLGIGCVRLPILQKGEVNFQHITGAPGMPLSYNEIFEVPSDFQSNQGTTVMSAKTPGRSTAANGASTTQSDTKVSITGSGDAADLIARSEGYRANAYDDGVGNQTIGYGHKITRGDNWKSYDNDGDGKLSKDEAKELLKADIAKNDSWKKNLSPNVNLTPGQEAALSSMAFNLGPNNPGVTKAVQMINQGAPADAVAAHITKYDKARDVNTGQLKSLAGLTKRRQEEAELFRRG